MIDQKANLLSIYDPSYHVESRVEVEDLLSLIQARATYASPSVPGVHKLVAEEDPRRLIGRLRYLHDLEPEKFQFTLYWSPVDGWCMSNLQDIVELVSRMAEDIKEDESWKIVLKRTQCGNGGIGKLVDTLSHCVLKPRSDILNPQRIIFIHMMGGETAVSLLSPNEMLEVSSKLPALPTGDARRRVSVD